MLPTMTLDCIPEVNIMTRRLKITSDGTFIEQRRFMTA